MTKQIVEEIQSKILNHQILDQLNNNCDFSNINYLSIIDTIESIKSAKYTEDFLHFDELKLIYENKITYFYSIDKLFEYRITHVTVIEAFLSSTKEMEEKIADQLKILIKSGMTKNIIPNFSNKINKQNIQEEFNFFIQKAVKYVKENYQTYSLQSRFVNEGLSETEITLIDNY